MDIQKKNILNTVAIAALGVIFNNNKKRKRRVWVKEYRQQFSHLPLIYELRENYPDDFKNYLRMDSSSFYTLLDKIKFKIKKQDTIMRKSISPEERLTATLRFLATGRSYEDLKYSTGISPAAMSTIVPETCKALYEVLKMEFMKVNIGFKKVLNKIQDKLFVR